MAAGSGEPEPAPTLPACRLALYVYEYLLHVGAQKSAQTFLSEVSQPCQAELPLPHTWRPLHLLPIGAPVVGLRCPSAGPGN